MKGIAGSSHVVIFISTTLMTFKVWRISILMPKEDSWNSLKSSYDKHLGILKLKYCEPSKSFDFFIAPFKRGDGNEMQAVRSEKCVYSSFWSKVALTLEISQNDQVRIAYENILNAALGDVKGRKLIAKYFSIFQ